MRRWRWRGRAGTGDRVSASSVTDGESRCAFCPRTAAHLRRIVEHLARLEEDDREGDRPAGRLFPSDQKRRSLIVWLTDLSETTMTPDIVRAASPG
jgi:uncharacterized protein (DUF58 family)